MTVEERREKLKVVKEKKKSANETMSEAWERIYSSKLTDKDREKMDEVKAAMEAGEIERDPADMYTKKGTYKKFSKAEALRMWRVVKRTNTEKKLRNMVENTPNNYHLVTNINKLREMKKFIKSADVIAVDCETFVPEGIEGSALDPWTNKMAGFSVSTDENHFYIPLNHNEKTNLDESTVVSELKSTLESSKIVMHNAPFDCKCFWLQYKIDLISPLHADTQVMAMSLNENRKHKLKGLCEDWLQMEGDNFNELFEEGVFNTVPLKVATVYAAGDTEKTLKLYRWMLHQMSLREDLMRIKKLLFEIEMPVMKTFICSDIRGLHFDVEEARTLDKQFECEIKEISEDIYNLLGEKINLNSNQQLSNVLFNKLKLPNPENGSTSTKKVLAKISNKHPVIRKLIEYRQVHQLRKAFTNKLPNNIKPDGKIHQSHNSWGTVTGRFTCSNPNTQQMPSKRPEIRRLFKPDPGRIFVSIDYSQIELRVLAHLANDPVLIESFHKGRDIHSATAAQISGIPYEQVEERKDVDGSIEQKLRKQAKSVNFGIVYGMTPVGLSTELDISQKEAEKLIDSYFASYPSIKEYMDKQVELVRKMGYVVDLFGRKRRLGDRRRKFLTNGEKRQAGNSPVQASAATILKKSVVDLQPILPTMDVNIRLQVHDELLFDCPRDISQDNLLVIRDTMANAVKLKVPIFCDIEIYPDRWAEKVEFDNWFGRDLRV
ncbi:DNA polymerase [Melghirimyces algeriensis]|uniref:DNA polymerase I n=1 Tax=Melghirimyces algeriensis TaxID=910412 RepID=A0A521F9Q0_9BACL|nr:DNA polymerase [Melghirimyces algeriensis]SMO92220.1 DNA polymerase-1 [Melghirimyces algeriensis]